MYAWEIDVSAKKRSSTSEQGGGGYHCALKRGQTEDELNTGHCNEKQGCYTGHRSYSMFLSKRYVSLFLANGLLKQQPHYNSKKPPETSIDSIRDDIQERLVGFSRVRLDMTKPAYSLKLAHVIPGRQLTSSDGAFLKCERDFAMRTIPLESCRW